MVSMNYQETTMVPNKVFTLFPKLKPSSVLVLLIIIRQTVGWYNPKTKRRKVRDWISYKQFNKKTGLSIKTISQAIRELIHHNLIKATDYKGNELSTTELRKGKTRIYYQCLLVDRKKSNTTMAKKYREYRKNIPITKLTFTKLTLQNKRKHNVRNGIKRIDEILSKKNLGKDV